MKLKLEEHNVKKAIADQMTNVREIDGAICVVDPLSGVIRTGTGHDQRWFEVRLRDVTPARFLSVEEQIKRKEEDLEAPDWWMVSSSQRMVFIRNKSRFGAIEDFLRRFPCEAAFGMDSPDAELARTMTFIDDEGDRLRQEKVAEIHEEAVPAPEEPEWPSGVLDRSCCDAGCCGTSECEGGCSGAQGNAAEAPPVLNPGDYYFGIVPSEDSGDDYWVMSVVPRDHWDRTGALLSAEIPGIQKLFPKYLQDEPDMELMWVLPEGVDPEVAALDMCCAGFIRCPAMEGRE